MRGGEATETHSAGWDVPRRLEMHLRVQYLYDYCTLVYLYSFVLKSVLYIYLVMYTNRNVLQHSTEVNL